MLGKVYSAGILGIEGQIVCCEADVSGGLPAYIFTGYLASQIKEASDRIRAAIKNAGIYLQPKRVLVNLSPASFKKSGSSYDLPIAVAILLAYDLLQLPDAEKSLFIGELSLSGEILPVQGLVNMMKKAKEEGFTQVFLPRENVEEAAGITGLKLYPLRNLQELYEGLSGRRKLSVFTELRKPFVPEEKYPDFKEIKGQSFVKQAAITAVAGGHHFLMLGGAGTGKSMISRALAGIMPLMGEEESIETTMIYSATGNLGKNEGLIRTRPFRSPHHSISVKGLLGGGACAGPGEMSLAHNGILFLDELAEFRAEALEALRQPLEEQKVHISRVHGKYVYPANFMLCGAANPCKCGFYPDRDKCNCSPAQVRRYLGKISKPLLDRIDICVETGMVSYGEMQGKEEASRTIRERVVRARDIQRKRLQNWGIFCNGQMQKEQLDVCCSLSAQDEAFLKDVYERKAFSARVLHKILKIARTAADLEGEERIGRRHLCEAIAYRTSAERYFGGGCADVER